MMELDDVVTVVGGEIFQPHVSNTRRTTVTYPDLSEYLFTPEEKGYFCAMVRGDVPSDGLTLAALSRRYEVNRNTCQGWMTIYDRGGIFHSKPGCPTVFDDAASTLIVQTLEKNKSLKKVLHKTKKKKHKAVRATRVVNAVNDKASTKKLLNQVYVDTQIARKRTRIRQEMDPKTLKNTMKRLKIKTGKAGVMTNARLKAGQNPRSSYTMYIMLEAFSSMLDPHNKWNSDATQLTCDSDSKGGLVCYVDTHDDNIDNQPLASTNFSGDLSIAAKWMHLNNAAGEVAPIILIFAVPSMPEGKCFIRKVKGLRNTAHPDSYGYIIFSKTRAGNSELWNWYFMDFVIPFIKESSERRQNKVSYLC